jgi:CRP-like cAMP-binding protein
MNSVFAKIKMAEGARMTHKARTDRTLAKIRAAVMELRRSGRRVTKKAVAAMAGISREHLTRRYAGFFI